MGGLLLFLLVFVLLLAGFPVAFSLGGISLFVLWLVEPQFLGFFPSRVFGVMSNQLLMAVPLFVYMGVMLERSGLAEELLETMALLFGRLRGGLAVSVIVVGALLAASTGIVGATVVTMGLLSLPTMLKRGYSPAVAAGTISSSGTLGQIIPPSIVLVLLGDQLQVAIGDMFIAALGPGLVLVGLYLLYVLALGAARPRLAPAMPAAELAAFRGLGGDRYLQDLVSQTGLSAAGFLLVFMVVVFIAGFFIDFIEITFILVPVAYPLFGLFELDLLWVGVLIAINLQTSFLTPPFGFSLFYLKGVAPPQVRTIDIYRGIIPFVAIQLVGLALVYFVPELATWLPRAMAGP